MGALIQLRCCISGDVVERDNPDGYSLQVQKFETKSPGGWPSRCISSSLRRVGCPTRGTFTGGPRRRCVQEILRM